MYQLFKLCIRPLFMILAARLSSRLSARLLPRLFGGRLGAITARRRVLRLAVPLLAGPFGKKTRMRLAPVLAQSAAQGLARNASKSATRVARGPFGR